MPNQPFRQDPPSLDNVSRNMYGIRNISNSSEFASVDMVFVLLKGVTLASGSATVIVPDFMPLSKVSYLILKQETMNASRQVTVTSAVAGSEVVDILIFGQGYQIKGA